MLTRCPACATHFRVTPDQLKLRAGRVRCGECQHVFNALDTLIEEPPIIIAPAPTPAVEPTPPPALPTPETEHADAIAVAPAPTFESGATVDGADADINNALAPPVADDSDRTVAETGDPIDEPAAGAFQVAPLPTDLPRAAADIAVVDDAASAADQDPTGAWEESFAEPPPPRRWPWILGSLFALAALGVQATALYRTELAVLWPELKPALVAACQALGCEIGLPAKVALVGIEASDLHPDTAQKGRLALTATLKNRAPFAQRFPHLELTLTDTADKAIVRKVLAPVEYLPRTSPVANGMTPNVDISISIGIDAGELPASGYRLYIFYP